MKEAAKYLTGRTGRKFKKIDIFQAASKGQIKLSADFLATVKVNIGTVEPTISFPGNRVQYEEYRRNPHFGVIGTFDLWVEAPGSDLHEVIDGDLQIGRPFPCGLHFTTDSPDRVVEILNDDGTIAKNLPKDARWMVRMSSLEDYLNAYAGAAPSSENDFDSDAALGAVTRAQRKNFADRPRDAREAREREYQGWRDASAEIQEKRERPATKRHLSALVKERLNLPDSEETIRKRL